MSATVTENRDPAFWRAIADHPQVRPLMNGLPMEALENALTNESVLPLASENGGFLFITRDGWGRVRELHTLFRPEGWGREALRASKAAAERVFGEGCDLIITYADTANYRTQPPRSFGFRQCAAPFKNEHGEWATWALSAADWGARCQR